MTTETEREELRAGDYFYASWGYDQTNIDFCVVVKVSPTGKTVTCQMVSPIHVGECGQSNVLTPGQGYGELFRLKVTDHGLVGSYPFIAGENSKRFGYFSKTAVGEEHHETMAEFGH